jgi:DNA polymerase-3 subunit delta'
VEPEGNFILIEQIDELLRSVSLKNFEGQVKVIIIDDVEKMTTEAANSLLKTLEEPPRGVVFILVSSNLESVLPTIISRCRIVQFKSLPLDETVSFLMSRYTISSEEAELAARLNGGILGAAISFATSPSKRERRASVLHIAQKIDRADLAEVSFMAETLLREIKRPLDELKAKQKRDIDEIKERSGQTEIPSGVKKKIEQRQKRETSHEEGQGFMDILGVLASWYRDIMLLQETNNQEMLVNRDQTQLIREYAGVLTSADACKCLEVIEETRQYSRFNVNMQLAFETMLFKIHDVVAVRDASYF